MTRSRSDSLTNPVVLFDGICGLCNRSVDFIIRNDKRGTFKFASLQSNYAAKTLDTHNISSDELDSVILLFNDRALVKSRAAVQILLLLGGWRRLLGRTIQLLPKKFTDIIYDWIARNRYSWFGKMDSCRIPSKDEKSRFLD